MRLKTYKMAMSILPKFLPLKWNISRTIWRIEVGDGSFFFAFFTLFHLSLTFFRPEVPFKGLLFDKKTNYLAQILQSLSYEVYSIILPKFKSFGLFIPVLGTSAIMDQTACCYNVTTSETGLLTQYIDGVFNRLMRHFCSE